MHALSYVELYEDWRPFLVGDALFTTAHPSTYYFQIREELQKRGYAIRSWDREAHTPWLMTWEHVKTWDNFKHWLGLSLPRPDALTPETFRLVFSNLGPFLRDRSFKRFPKEKLVLFMWEPPAVQPEIWDSAMQQQFGKVYSWDDTLVDNVNILKFYLPDFKASVGNFVPYEERQFLTLIASRLGSPHPKELYSQREKLIRYFEARPEIPFDLYGRNWAKRKFRCWKGTIPDKFAVLKQYRFAIAYENTAAEGYITEKLWDCFATGVVPIYWGAPNVTRYIPEDCFIDRRKFQNDEELVTYLQAMPKEEWERYVQRAQEFLLSDKVTPFTHEAFTRTFIEALFGE